MTDTQSWCSSQPSTSLASVMFSRKSRDGPVAVLRGELLGRGDKLLDVGQPFLVLRVGAVLQHLPVAAAVEHLPDDLVGRGVGQLRQLVHQLGEVAQAGRRLALDEREPARPRRRRQQAQSRAAPRSSRRCSSDTLPMPRAGSLTARRKDRSSRGLSSSRR